MAEPTYTFDIQPWIDEAMRNAHAAMETAARGEIIRWLRDHGYTVIEPERLTDV